MFISWSASDTEGSKEKTHSNWIVGQRQVKWSENILINDSGQVIPRPGHLFHSFSISEISEDVYITTVILFLKKSWPPLKHGHIPK